MFNLFNKDKKKDKKEKETPNVIDFANSKYPDEICALCGKKGCDKKWGGQHWHKKCLRAAKGMAKGMI